MRKLGKCNIRCTLDSSKFIFDDFDLFWVQYCTFCCQGINSIGGSGGINPPWANQLYIQHPVPHWEYNCVSIDVFVKPSWRWIKIFSLKAPKTCLVLFKHNFLSTSASISISIKRLYLGDTVWSVQKHPVICGMGPNQNG